MHVLSLNTVGDIKAALAPPAPQQPVVWSPPLPARPIQPPAAAPSVPLAGHYNGFPAPTNHYASAGPVASYTSQPNPVQYPPAGQTVPMQTPATPYLSHPTSAIHPSPATAPMTHTSQQPIGQQPTG